MIPRATVKRIMKTVIDNDIMISKDAVDTMVRFIEDVIKATTKDAVSIMGKKRIIQKKHVSYAIRYKRALAEVI